MRTARKTKVPSKAKAKPKAAAKAKAVAKAKPKPKAAVKAKSKVVAKARAKAARKAKSKDKPKAVAKPTGAYLLLRLHAGCDRRAILAELRSLDHFAVVHAVHGPYDLVLLSSGAKPAELHALVSRLRSRPGVAEVALRPVVTPRPAVVASKTTSPSAYLFADVEEKRLGVVLPQLRSTRGVLSCHAISAPAGVVALVQGETLLDLEKTIAEQVPLIDGITRTCTAKVINL